MSYVNDMVVEFQNRPKCSTSQKSKHSNITRLVFDEHQSDILEIAAIDIARLGGPQMPGAQLTAKCCAKEITATFNNEQLEIARGFATGRLPLVIFEGMIGIKDDTIPQALPALSDLEKEFDCLRLASRNQILLHLVGHQAFAYDIDNNGQITRLVGNFKGGGETKIENESEIENVELSSHSGLALGAHTEAPYHCAIRAVDNHSPAPSALILSARWNPLNEPTSIIPMIQVIENIGKEGCLALTLKVFKFSRSDSFVSGKGEGADGVSILEFDNNGNFALRYNSYRFSLCEDAPVSAEIAFELLKQEIALSDIVGVSLQPNNAVVINNTTALHCRDVIKDNRRLLVRLFGYSENAQPIVLSDDPLIVQG
ncbi:hypothetical protein [Serratia microhaemolytica]|uniref:hypothetical protein n=1 Tax=Serratia microhaemolytica TaxID=2675110 RepID=UPI001981217C|nr:hypothetical protein [Serratia microhaemolytica]